MLLEFDFVRRPVSLIFATRENDDDFLSSNK